MLGRQGHSAGERVTGITAPSEEFSVVASVPVTTGRTDDGRHADEGNGTYIRWALGDTGARRRGVNPGVGNETRGNYRVVTFTGLLPALCPTRGQGGRPGLPGGATNPTG